MEIEDELRAAQRSWGGDGLKLENDKAHGYCFRVTRKQSAALKKAAKREGVSFDTLKVVNNGMYITTRKLRGLAQVVRLLLPGRLLPVAAAAPAADAAAASASHATPPQPVLFDRRLCVRRT